MMNLKSVVKKIEAFFGRKNADVSSFEGVKTDAEKLMSKFVKLPKNDNRAALILLANGKNETTFYIHGLKEAVVKNLAFVASKDFDVLSVLFLAVLESTKIDTDITVSKEEKKPS